MRGPTGERPGQQPPAEPDLVGDVEPVRVHHDRGVDALQGSVAGQDLLARVPLLGGRAEQHHPAGGRVARGHDLVQCEERADAGRRDDIVAAGVADAGQRVVLGADRDGRAGRVADLGPERRRHPVRAQLRLDAVPCQHLDQRRRAAVLLEGGLGMLVQPPHDLGELRLQPLCRPLDRGDGARRARRRRAARSRPAGGVRAARGSRAGQRLPPPGGLGDQVVEVGGAGRGGAAHAVHRMEQTGSGSR